MNAITSGNWVVGNIVAIDTLKRTLYFYGYGKEKNINPHFYTLYKANIDREGVTPLAVEDGQHTVNFFKSNRYFIDTYSKVNQVPTINVKDTNGRIVVKLAKPDISSLIENGWTAPEPFSVKAADNRTNLYGVMYKPSNFDPKKKYPIISIVYPGPYYGYVPTSFSINRVGIFGHSGGGFMAAAAILTYPDFYKVAVSCSGNHDNNIFNRGWGECYNGVREVEKTETDASGKQKTEYEYKFQVKTNQELAKNLKGHLLLVTGDMDTNVNPAHTYRLADALIKAGKDFDMLVIPGAGHGYGSADDYFEQKMNRYFAKYLIGDYRADKWGDIFQTK